MTDDDRSEDGSDREAAAEQARQRLLKLHGGNPIETEELWNLVDMSEEMFSVTGFDGRFRVLNKAWETTLGLSRAELRACPFMDFVHPDDRDKTGTVMDRILHGVRLFSFQNRYRTKDGSYRPLTWQALVSTERQRIYAIARDATAHLEAQEQENVLDAVLEQSRDAVVIQSPDGRVTAWGGAAEQLFGHAHANIVGEPLSRFLSRDGAPTDLLALLSAAPGLDRIDAHFHHKNGSNVPVQLTITAVGDGATQITGAVATMWPA